MKNIIKIIQSYKCKYHAYYVYDDGVRSSYYLFLVNSDTAKIKYKLFQSDFEISKTYYDLYSEYFLKLHKLIYKYGNINKIN